MTGTPHLSYHLEWTREIWRDALRQRLPARWAVFGTKRQRLVLAVGTVALLFGPLFLVTGLGQIGLGAYFGFMAGALGLFLVLRFVVVPFFRDRRIDAELALQRQRGPVDVRLDAHGIVLEGRHSRSHFGWPHIIHVSTGRQSLVIWTGVGAILPLPFSALGTGVTPEDVLGRIAVWRGTGDAHG